MRHASLRRALDGPAAALATACTQRGYPVERMPDDIDFPRTFPDHEKWRDGNALIPQEWLTPPSA